MSQFEVVLWCLAFASVLVAVLVKLDRMRTRHAADIRESRERLAELEAMRSRYTGSRQDTLRMLDLAHAVDVAKTPEEEARAVQAFERHFDERVPGGTKP